MKKVLLIGESWHVHVTESKGFDVFTYDYYETAEQYLRAAVEGAGYEFHHIPSHMVEYDFPKTVEGLLEYSVIMLSDVGANTFNLPMNVFQRLNPTPNRLEMLREYVSRGGSLVMIGGYLTFQGIQGRGCYRNSALAGVLPVELLEGDDRIEKSAGIKPEVVCPEHKIVSGMPGDWPQLLGYNRLIPKKDSEVIVKLEDDPMIVIGYYGKGKSVAYATDCAPHWSPEEFCNWEGYRKLWANIIDWLTE